MLQVIAKNNRSISQQLVEIKSCVWYKQRKLNKEIRERGSKRNTYKNHCHDRVTVNMSKAEASEEGH